MIFCLSSSDVYVLLLSFPTRRSSDLPKRPRAVGRLRGEIEFDDVRFTYRTDDKAAKREAMAGVSLRIPAGQTVAFVGEDRKSTRLNSSHLVISYAVFCLKKKK